MNKELQVEVVSMSYPSSTGGYKTIENLSFCVPSGGFVSFVGPSGAGKTTLLRIIAGLETRYTGRVTLGDECIIAPTRRIQMVFQDYRLLPWRTVAKNIEFAVPRVKSDVAAQLTNKWITNVRLDAKKDSWPKDLSGGQEGLVAFARTFVDPPEVLLLDEPFRNLDLVAKLKLQHVLLDAISDKKLIVAMVSHSVDDALVFSDTIFLVSDSPMTIKQAFSAVGEVPRQRTDKQFRELSESIANELLNMTQERVTDIH